MRNLPHCNNEEVLDPTQEIAISYDFTSDWLSQKDSVYLAVGADIEKKAEPEPEEQNQSTSLPVAQVKKVFQSFSPLPQTPPSFPGPDGMVLKSITAALGKAMRLEGAEVDSNDHTGDFIKNAVQA